MRKLFLAFATLFGFSLTVYLTIRTGLGDIADVLSNAGFAIGFVIAAHVVQIIFSAFAWYLLVDDRQVSLEATILLRWVRESISNLLPLTQVGGEVIGIRLLALRGVDSTRSAASILIDMTLEFMTQIPFTICGLFLFLAVASGTQAANMVIAGTAFLVVAAVGFGFAQRGGLWLFVEQSFEYIAERISTFEVLRLPGLSAAISKTYSVHQRVVSSCCWHLASWFSGAAEIWIAMYVIGIDANFTQALILESVGQAARSAAIMIPGGLGVQEGSFIFLGSWLGIPADAALGLSFVKRIRELILGIPGLLSWYAIEERHVRRGASRRADLT